MILTEYLNDGTLIKHYSDAGFMLLQVETGIKYANPIDLAPCIYSYEETSEKIDNGEDTTVYDDINALQEYKNKERELNASYNEGINSI